MTDDDLRNAIAIHQNAAALLEAELIARERARATARDDDSLITPGEATRICGRDETTVRKDCANNQTHLGGFAVKLGGRWRIYRGKYAKHIEQHGLSRFRR
ncbi:hypothetical protein [Bradyrhizobium sp. CCBAU 51765]|uniref:hypothetical protein n=1 Tax=Bradyrhizobium sp. CCBAU 51765 TaxID=1325102 RepID=UPI001888AD99|nr:hypothetical protein [Bradyrhizobium sp. CCBAU 51765]QOZ09542.1 hypothetical protein XH96_19890 [Bradyrhizobium sp. CCBAU 51765]